MTRASQAPAPDTGWDIVYVPLASQGYGGAERSLLDLATRFQRAGLRVLVLVGEELAATDFVEAARARDIPLQTVHWNHRHSYWRNWQACRAVWPRLRPRLVHVNISWHDKMWFVAACARAMTGARLLGSMRAMPDPHELVPRRRYLGVIPGLQLWHLMDVVTGALWGRVLHHTVTVNARDYGRRLVAHFHYPADRLSVVYNGIDTRMPAVPALVTDALRASVGAGPDDCLVAFVGRISKEKGGDVLLRALAGAAPGVRVVFIGDGPQEAEWQALADTLGLDRRASFVGYRANVTEWMAAADAVAVPSLWYEAFGRVVVEAMQQGTPVIASRIGGMAELFEDGRHGLYVPAGEVEALRSALDTLAAAPARRRAMGEAGRTWVSERYSLERVERDYGALYSRLAGLPALAEAAPHG